MESLPRRSRHGRLELGGVCGREYPPWHIYTDLVSQWSGIPDWGWFALLGVIAGIVSWILEKRSSQPVRAAAINSGK